MRYYRMVLGVEERKESKVLEYKYGLMWVWKYYKKGCEDEKWRYSGASPLIKDIAEAKVPEMKRRKGSKSEIELCKYVLSERELSGLLKIEKGVKEKVVPETLYKRYMWECHMRIEAL